MGRLYVYNARMVGERGLIAGGSITVDAGKISALGGPRSADGESIDAGGLLLLPGLVDLHAHGRLALPDLSRFGELIDADSLDFAKAGVTSYLVTLATAPLELWLDALAALDARLRKPFPGAVPLGAYLEGVFINGQAAGAQPPQWIRAYDQEDDRHRALFERFPGLVRAAALAPEIPANLRLVEECLKNGVVPAIGHTAASPDEVRAAVDLGATHMVHIMNGMKAMHHRDPGPIPAGLLDDRISVELICDGFHVHPEMVRLIHRVKPPEKVVLITDSVTIDLPGAKPGALDEPNRLPDGRLAGSRLRLWRGVKNYLDFTGCGLAEAVAAASLNPCRVLGLDRERGSLTPGKKADFFLAGDDLEPRRVFIGGRELGI